MLKYGQEYVTQSIEEYEAKVKAKVLKVPKRKAAAMGFQLAAAHAVSKWIEAVATADRPVVMHNAKKPNPPASVCDTGGLGGLSVSSKTRARNSLRAVAPRSRQAGKFMGRRKALNNRHF